METEMSEGRGISSIGLLLSAMLHRCKRTAAGHWRWVSRTVWLRVAGHGSDPFESVRPVHVGQPPRIGLCGEDIELKELIRILTIGDRVRILCDDGVLVAEKISQTQFKLIDSIRMSRLVH